MTAAGARCDPPAMGEFELIHRYFDRGPARHARLGIGDDSALLGDPDPGACTAVATDMLLEGRHFFADVDPESLGHKALAVNLSDLAAMGARPRAFTLAIALPRADSAWLAAFARGLFALADAHGCELVGGDTTRGPLAIAITVFGDVAPAAALRRDRAQPGDDLWVSGALGEAAHAVRERLDGRPLPAGDPCVRRMEWPQPRVALGLALRHLARAAIDVSDGLAGDLAHVCERSRVGMRIDALAVPAGPGLPFRDPLERARAALLGGDDYELAFTAPAENRAAIAALGPRVGVALTRIGEVTAGEGIVVVDGRGLPIAVPIVGHDHFAAGVAE